MQAAPVRQTLDDRGIATVVLNRPDKGNAYNAEMLDALGTVWSQLQSDPRVRIVVLRGEGKHFCVGADLIQGASPKPVTAATPTGAGLIDVCSALDRLSKPTVAVVQGGCIGGGVGLVACCDVVIAEPASFFSIPEVRIGFAPAPLTPYFLRALGARALRHYGQTGERFGAVEARRIGLVHVVADPGDTAGSLVRVLGDLLQGAPSALATFKTVIEQVDGLPVTPQLLAKLQAGFDQARESSDAVEGRAAFRDKRKPRWAPEG